MTTSRDIASQGAAWNSGLTESEDTLEVNNVRPYSELDLASLKMPDGSTMCPVCFIKIRRPNHFARHYRKHTGDKKFVCPVCNYKSTRRDYLTRHLMAVHPLDPRSGLVPVTESW